MQRKQWRSMWDSWLLLTNLACSLFMTGVIWFVQVVHYPLFERIGPDNFAWYQERHQRLTTRVVAPAMIMELAASFALVLGNPSSSAFWVPSGMTLLVWASTMLWQVPLHAKLASGFNQATWITLVASNWIRTIAWTLRSILLLWLAARTNG